jgi:hypothetical protein
MSLNTRKSSIHTGPSMNCIPPASFSTFAPGASSGLSSAKAIAPPRSMASTIKAIRMAW